MGLKFHGSLSQALEQRTDFIHNIQMGGNRIAFSLASLRYYISYITEPFAFFNILGNIGPFAILSFLAYGTFFNQKIVYSCLYCSFVGIGIELFQYFMWFGAFDISDIFLRFIGILTGMLIHMAVVYLYFPSASVWGS